MNNDDIAIDRASYVRMFGPTVGDRIRLADSTLFVEIERDLTTPGYELLAGAERTCGTGRDIGLRRRHRMVHSITCSSGLR